MFLNNILIISFVWLIFLPLILHFASQQVSLIGIYHELVVKEQKDVGESFAKKVMKIFKVNFILSIPLMISFYIFINDTIGKSDMIKQPQLNVLDPLNSIILALVISGISLSSARFLSNPTEITRPSTCKINSCKKYDPTDTFCEEFCKFHKERILSFFYAIICTSLIVLMIILSSNVILGININHFEVPNIPSNDALIIIIVYIISLLLITLVIELLFLYVQPLIKTPYKPFVASSSVKPKVQRKKKTTRKSKKTKSPFDNI